MMLLVLTLTVLAGSMAGGLALSSQAERHIAAAHRRAVQLSYAAESATERCVVTLEAQPDWREVPGVFVCGAVTSGADIEARTLALNRSLTSRFPFGADTPRWRPVSISAEGAYQSTVWIADDPADRDGVSAQDSNGRVMVRAETRTTGDAVRIIEVHLERTGGVTRRLSWREVW
jgi:hypothetical protein